MIKNWIVTGDTHGGVQAVIRVSNIQRNYSDYKPYETAIIILGDAGLNFYLNKTDKKYKKVLNDMGYRIYCVRGNHEERPENLGYDDIYDNDVHGEVWYDPDFDNIYYLMDGGEYTMGKYSVLVLGGGYSVDKWYRLARAGYSPGEAETADPKRCGWFKDECLTAEEMEAIGYKVANKEYDFVLSHTCPLSWQPTDLFLGCVDQSSVDNSMEVWMDELKEHIGWYVWLFGHYHADRVERYGVEQFFNDYEDLDTIWNRWQDKKTYASEWWLTKSPYMKEWDLEHETKV